MIDHSTNPMRPPRTDYVTSRDGTEIGYVTYGSGPGVILIQGAMGTEYHFRDLAHALSDSFTVYVPDRRGRGKSPRPYGDDYVVQRDIEDLAALLTATGGRFVYGLSSGGMIALQAGLSLPAIEKLAVYEPAIFLAGLPIKALARFDRQMARGRLAGAMVAAMKASQMGPPALRYAPSWLLIWLVQMLMSQEAKAGSSELPTMRELALTVPYDFKVVRSMNDKLQSFTDIRKPVLLLGGSKSPAYLKAGLSALEKVLQDTKRIELAGLGHSGSWNHDGKRNADGNPKLVAEQLRSFFGGS